MTIPNTTTPTTQLDNNTDQLPGTDTTDSAREQILDAVQKLNDIINQYGGAEMITSANLDTQNIAQTNKDNKFTVGQSIEANPPSIVLKTLGVGTPQYVLRDSGDFNLGAFKYSLSGAYVSLDHAGAAGELRLGDDDSLKLLGLGLSEFAIDSNGDMIFTPGTGNEVYKNLALPTNRYLIASEGMESSTFDAAGTRVGGSNQLSASLLSGSQYRVTLAQARGGANYPVQVTAMTGNSSTECIATIYGQTNNTVDISFRNDTNANQTPTKFFVSAGW